MSIFSSVFRRRDARPQQPTRRGGARRASSPHNRSSAALTLACTEMLESRRLMSVTLVSSNANNTASANNGADPLFGPFISTTGRYVAFESSSTDVVFGVNSGQQVYLRDRIAGTTQLVSRGLNNQPAAGTSWLADMTPDGRYVLFFTTANLTSSNIGGNRVPIDNNDTIDLYLRDMQLGQTFLISGDSVGGGTNPTGGQLPPTFVASGVSNDGTQPTLPAYISNDGRYISFATPANNIGDQSDMTQSPAGADDDNDVDDIYRRDRQTNLTLLVTEGQTAGNAPAASVAGQITEFDMAADGGTIAFITTSAMLTGNTPLPIPDAFRRVVDTGVTNLVSVSAPLPSDIVISPDGSIIAFQHNNPGWVPAHIDIAIGAGPNSPFTPIEDNTVFGPIAISADQGARYVVFRSADTNLIDQPTSGVNVFRYDRVTGITELVSLGSTGGTTNLIGNARAGRLSVTADGRFVVYESDSTGGDPAVSNYGSSGQMNVYVRDMTSTQVTLLNVKRDDSFSAASGDAYQSVLSADGKVVAFISDAPDLVLNDTNGDPDVFTADVILTTNPLLKAFLNAPTVTTGGATSYTFQVTYSGPRPIVLASIDDNDIFVSNRDPLDPGGQSQADPNYQVFQAELVSVNSGVNANAVTATYRIVPPGGSWDQSDNNVNPAWDPIIDGQLLGRSNWNNTYFVHLNNRQISDIQGAQLLDQNLGTFTVNISVANNVGPTFNGAVSETAGTFTFPIPLGTGSETTAGLTVDYVVVSGSATFGQDFAMNSDGGLLQSGTLVLKPDGTFDPIVLDIINDSLVEGSESFQIIFSNATPGLLLAFQKALITIVDDDNGGSGTVIIPGANNTDPNTGDTPGSTITLNNGVPTVTAPETLEQVIIPVSRAGTGTTASKVVFNYTVYALPGDTAVAGQNFVADSGTIEFDPGSDIPSRVVSNTFGTIPGRLFVRLLHDGKVTGDLTFTVVLTNATTGLIIGGTSVKVVVQDVDSAVQFTTNRIDVVDDNGVIEVPITRTGNLNTSSTVVLTIAGSTATIGTHFSFDGVDLPNNPLPVVTFAPGETTKTVRIRLIGDAEANGNYREIVLGILSASASTAPLVTNIGTPATQTIGITYADALGPQVSAVDFKVTDGRITAITVQFSEKVVGNTARRASNYALFPRSAGGKLGRILKLASVKYNAGTQTATLIPASPLPADALYQLNVNGRGTIKDLSGNKLDGDGDGVVGGSAVTVLGTSTALSYTDVDNDLVSLRLSGPGTLKYINLNRAVTVEVLGPGNGSELFGAVTQRKGGDDQAELTLLLNGAEFDPGDEFTGDIIATSSFRKRLRR